MHPRETGDLYNNIALWWSERLANSQYGLKYVSKDIAYSKRSGDALDVGCGSSARISDSLLAAGFNVSGLDVSESMIELAKRHNPDVNFIHADVCEWEPSKTYEIIVAWDSTFHVPHAMQAKVTAKLCTALSPGGILLLQEETAMVRNAARWKIAKHCADRNFTTVRWLHPNTFGSWN